MKPRTAKFVAMALFCLWVVADPTSAGHAVRAVFGWMPRLFTIVTSFINAITK